MKRSTKVMAFMAVCLLLASSAFAASPWTTESTYKGKVAAKLDFGVKNLLGGWTELLPCNSACAKDGHKTCPAMCCAKSLGTGIVNAAIYTVGGAVHTATFLIPVDVPLPNDGVQF